MSTKLSYLRKQVVPACYLLIIGVWIAWCFFFLSKGIDFTDEGYYCSEAWKFAQGELPFRDSLAIHGLSFWFLSWVFYICPQCPLLGLRILWAIVLLVFALLTARIMFKYFNPVITTAGIIIGLFFAATSTNLKVLSYNTIPIIGLLLVVWLWITAVRGAKKASFVMAGIAGFVAFLSFLCRPPLALLVLLPVVTLICDYLYGKKTEKWAGLSGTYMAGFAAGLFITVCLLYQSDILFDIPTSILMVMQNSIGHGSNALVNNFAFSAFFYLVPSLAVALIIFVVRLKDFKGYGKSGAKPLITTGIILSAVIILILLTWPEFFSALQWLVNSATGLISNPLNPPDRINQLLLSLALCIIAAGLAVHLLEKDTAEEKEPYERYLWSFAAIFLILLMILGTDNRPAYPVLEIACLPLAIAAGITGTLLSGLVKPRQRLNARAYILIAAVVLVTLFYVTEGLLPNRYGRRDGAMDKLTVAPDTAKLACTYTTAERAGVIDRIVESVRSNSKAGDRILAYDNIPMIFYLTDRLPATCISWISSREPVSLRKLILDDMLKRNRIPALVVKTSYTTRNPGWPVVKDRSDSRPENDPIDDWVNQHYKVIQDIDGFLIMAPINN